MYFVKFLVLCLLAFSGLAMGIDYNASNIREVVTKKYGLPFPKGYDRSLYSAAATSAAGTSAAAPAEASAAIG